MTKKMLSEDMRNRSQEDSSGKLKVKITFNFPLKCSAFTLAEVLITLAVIGVVAAMTLPVLIQKQQKMVWTNQLLKTYSTLEEGFKMALVDQETQDFSDSGCQENYNNFKNCMTKYFKATEVNLSNYEQKPIKPNSGGGNEDPQPKTSAISLADGSLLFYEGFAVTGAFILLDINGKKGPNTYGRDIFAFVIGTSHSGSNLVHPIGFGTLVYDRNNDYLDSVRASLCAFLYGNCKDGRFVNDQDVTDEGIAFTDDMARAHPGIGYTPRVLREKKMDY